MYKIQTEGYEKKDKRIIAKDYLIPNIIQQVNFNKDEIIIPDETIDYIVENFTEDENGVRNLKRCLEIIHTKLNLYRLMKPESKIFEKEMSLKVEFPFKVTTDIVSKLIKRNQMSNLLKSMYI
jgi:ATP-dependent Lon protease